MATKKARKKRKISDAQKQKEARITELVIEYQNGSVASDELLDYYNNLFNAYKSLLKDGNYRVNSKSVTEFVKLFMGDKVSRRKTKRYKVYSEFYNTVNHIRYYMQDLDAKDIEHELKVIFLTLAKNWKKMEGIVFTGYINGLFHYYVKDWVKRHMTGVPKDKDQEDINSLTNVVADHEDPADIVISDDIDEDWVVGLTCKWPWTELTKEEREDVVLLWQKKLNRKEYAYLKCMRQLADVSTRKKQIKDKIRTIINKGKQ